MRPQRPRSSDDGVGRGFIHSYGLFWSADEVPWFRRESESREQYRLFGRLGTRGPRLQVCDFRSQRGIYVLYDDYGPYYVGLTRVGTLGNRLKQHRSDQHRGAWDRFSWFGFAPVLRRGRYADGTSVLGSVPERLLADAKWGIRDIEALLIQTLGTQHRGNSMRGPSAAPSSGGRGWRTKSTITSPGSNSPSAHDSENRRAATASRSYALRRPCSCSRVCASSSRSHGSSASAYVAPGSVKLWCALPRRRSGVDAARPERPLPRRGGRRSSVRGRSD